MQHIAIACLPLNIQSSTKPSQRMTKALANESVIATAVVAHEARAGNDAAMDLQLFQQLT